VEAPEWACLLDVLDLIKDKVDGSLAYRKSCRMMICGSCGMRMDGAAVLACKTRMKPLAESGHVPVISAMGNMPVLKDLVVDMGPFWAKVRHMKPWLDTGYEELPEQGRALYELRADGTKILGRPSVSNVDVVITIRPFGVKIDIPIGITSHINKQLGKNPDDQLFDLGKLAITIAAVRRKFAPQSTSVAAGSNHVEGRMEGRFVPIA
jgi:hypothetical protein